MAPVWLGPVLEIALKLLSWVPFIGAYFKGRLDAKRKAEADRAKLLEKQLDIASRSPASRDELLKRMRRNGF